MSVSTTAERRKERREEKREETAGEEKRIRKERREEERRKGENEKNESFIHATHHTPHITRTAFHLGESPHGDIHRPLALEQERGCYCVNVREKRERAFTDVSMSVDMVCVRVYALVRKRTYAHSENSLLLRGSCDNRRCASARPASHTCVIACERGCE